MLYGIVNGSTIHVKRDLFGGGKRAHSSSESDAMLLFFPEPEANDPVSVKACLDIKTIDFQVFIGSLPLEKLEQLHNVILDNKPSGNIGWVIKPYLDFLPQWVHLQVQSFKHD